MAQVVGRELEVGGMDELARTRSGHCWGRLLISCLRTADLDEFR